MLFKKQSVYPKGRSSIWGSRWEIHPLHQVLHPSSADSTTSTQGAEPAFLHRMGYSVWGGGLFFKYGAILFVVVVVVF